MAIGDAEAGLLITPTVRLVRPLRTGGMGAVWVAEHLTLKTQVVVKFMSAELATDPANVARFSKEAAAAAAVKSPHVVQTFDHGVAPNGAPFIVMELLEGEDLAARIKREGPLPLAVVAKIVADASKALTRAHAAGIIHRDIKPENIFLCVAEEDEVFAKILDFGVAKIRDPTGSFDITRTGATLGTPYYMSPEQGLGRKDIDRRTDLWSLGVVVFEAITGIRPFDGDTIGALAVAIAHAPMPVPSRKNAYLGPAIDAWFARACARDLSVRFSTAKELSEAFQIAARAVVVVGGPASSAVSPNAATIRAPDAALVSSLAGAEHPKDANAKEPGLATTTSPTSDAGGDDPPPTPRPPAPRHLPAWIAAVAIGCGVGAAGAAGAVVLARARASSPPPTGLVQAPPVASAASTDTRPASTTEPDASNRWVRIEPPGAGQDAVSLGLSVEKGPDLGFRPSRGIKSPSLPYEIEQHEVTWDELDASSTARPEAKVPAGNAGGIPSGPPGPSDREARKKYPATGIAWTTALEHCKARGGSLPTEEQWEYAARGRDLRPYPWGTEPLDLTRTVAFRGTKAELAPVTSSDQDRTVDPPETALFDLAGNALEWTLDIYRDDRAGQPEGWAQEGGLTFRAVRGLPPADPAPKSLPKIGAAYRQALCATGPCPADTANVLQWVGFRCARLAK